MPGDIYVNASPGALGSAPPTSDFIQGVLDSHGQDTTADSAGSAPTAAATTSGFLQQAIDGKLPPAAAKPNTKPSATPASIAANAAAGANEGMIDVLGAPVDAITWALNKGVEGVNKVAGTSVPEIQNPVGGSQSIKNALGTVGMSPDAVQANTPAEAIARGIGAGATSAIAPEAVLGGLGAAGLGAMLPRTSEALQSAFGAGGGATQAATNAGIGALAGGTGEAAATVAPEPLKPIARMAGNLVGGGVGAVGAEAPTLAQAAVKAATDYAAPMGGQAAKEALAQRMFASGVGNRQEALDALQQGSGTGVGAVPKTAYQATGDAGIGAMERESETAEGGVGPFNERRSLQNDARVGVLKELQPTGDPAAVGEHIRGQLAALDGVSSGIDQAATANAQSAASAIPGNTTPEAVGAEARGHLAAANAGAKAREKALWDAVDPEGNLALGAAPIVSGARRIESEVAKSAKPMEGEEGKIFEAAKALEAVSSLKEITALRSRISEEMRNQRGMNGSAQSLARLTQLRGVVEKAITDAAEHKAGQEAVAVQSATMSPEETMAARLQADQNEFYRTKAEAVGGNSGGDNSAGRGGGSARVSGSNRAEIQTNGRSGNASGDSSVPKANLNSEAAGRIKSASEATKERAGTFKSGPVGEALAEKGTKGDYRLLDSSVGQKFWKPGAGGAEAVKAFTSATGNTPEAIQTLENIAALSLRRAAMREDGTLDPAKYEAWAKQHQDALRGLDGVSKVSAKFADAAKAAEAVADSTAARAAALDSYQKTAVGPFLKATDAGDVTKQIGSIFGAKNAIQNMRQLAAETAGNPDARDGLRKGIADYIAGRFVGNTDQVKSDTFQTFLRQNKPVLAQVFSHDELKGMEAVASELSKNKALADQAALPGRSTTAQDIIKTLNKAHEGPGHMSLFAEMMLGGTAGFEAHGLSGAAVGAGAAIAKNRLNAMRAAGMSDVRSLVRGMLLNPQLAREALERVGPEKINSRDIRFTQQLNRVAAIAATRMIAKKQDARP